MKLPPHVHAVKSRGRLYYYFQRNRGTGKEGGRLKLPGEPFNAIGTPNPEWWKSYELHAGCEESKKRAGSFEALIEAFQSSPEWKELSPERSVFKEVADVWGGLLVAGVEARHVLALRDKRAETPAAANYLVRSLPAMISWVIPRGYRSDNPCKHVRKLKGGEGYEPWSWDHILHFREHVSKPELWWAAALALYSGQRQSDDIAMLWSDVADGLVSVVQEKTETPHRHASGPAHGSG